MKLNLAKNLDKKYVIMALTTLLFFGPSLKLNAEEAGIVSNDVNTQQEVPNVQKTPTQQIGVTDNVENKNNVGVQDTPSTDVSKVSLDKTAVVEPIVKPVATPVIAPVLVPHQVPTVTPQIEQQSKVPTITSNVAPTVVPSLVPIVVPHTAQPVLTPTEVPSLVPALVPHTQVPSLTPVVTPPSKLIVAPVLKPEAIPELVPQIIVPFPKYWVPELNPVIKPMMIPPLVPQLVPKLMEIKLPIKVSIPSLVPNRLPYVEPKKVTTISVEPPKRVVDTSSMSSTAKSNDNSLKTNTDEVKGIYARPSAIQAFPSAFVSPFIVPMYVTFEGKRMIGQFPNYYEIDKMFTKSTHLYGDFYKLLSKNNMLPSKNTYNNIVNLFSNLLNEGKLKGLSNNDVKQMLLSNKISYVRSASKVSDNSLFQVGIMSLFFGFVFFNKKKNNIFNKK